MTDITQGQIVTLVKLQKLEIEIRKIKAFLDRLPAQIETLDLELEEIERSVDSDEEQINELNKKYRTYESDAQVNVGRIKKSEEKLRSVKTNKEYQSSLKEIDDLKAIGSQIEDQMLAVLEKIDQAGRELKERRQHYQSIVKETNQEKEAINETAEQRKNELLKLESDRSLVTDGLDAKLLDLFNRQRAKQADGVAIIRVIDAVCQGCNMNIPPQMYNELQRRDSLKNCPSCERLIYWQNEDDRSE
jgi:predicted  nucleic acid-binding Zn-ribbon protein